jgi:hypothetical protein
LNVLADDSMLVGGQYLIPDDAGYGLLERATRATEEKALWSG